MNGIGSDRVREPRFVTGLVLVVLAAVLMLATEASIAAPITVLVVGVVLIARSQREGQNRCGPRRPGGSNGYTFVIDAV